MYTRAYNGKFLDPIPPAFVPPDVSEASRWVSGKPWFMDPDQKYILRITNYSSHFLSVNTQFADATEIKTWRDLLNPKYKAKVSAPDPTISGAGWPPINYLMKQLGEDYISGLYKDNQVGVSRDARQISDWLARGQYPLSIGTGTAEIEALKKDGFPIVVLHDLPDAPGTLSAGFGLIGLVNQAPHPNAAKLFVNWIAGKDGGEVYNKAQVTVSARTDVQNIWAPDYIIPTPGVNYFDTYDWDWTVNGFNPEALEKIKRLTGVA